jgi:hypothetical protein
MTAGFSDRPPLGWGAGIRKMAEAEISGKRGRLSAIAQLPENSGCQREASRSVERRETERHQLEDRRVVRGGGAELARIQRTERAAAAWPASDIERQLEAADGAAHASEGCVTVTGRSFRISACCAFGRAPWPVGRFHSFGAPNGSPQWRATAAVSIEDAAAAGPRVEIGLADGPSGRSSLPCDDTTQPVRP